MKSLELVGQTDEFISGLERGATTAKHNKKRPATACRPPWFNSLQVEVNAEAIDMSSQIGRVSKGICGKCNSRSKGSEIGASGGYAAKIGIEVFALHRPTVTDFDLSACASGPTGQIVFFAAIFMGSGKSVSEHRRIVDVGHGQAAGAVNQHGAGNEADAR